MGEMHQCMAMFTTQRGGGGGGGGRGDNLPLVPGFGGDIKLPCFTGVFFRGEGSQKKILPQAPKNIWVALRVRQDLSYNWSLPVCGDIIRKLG